MKAGWEVKPLGEIFAIGSSKRVIKSEWKESGVPFYRAREIVKLAKNGYVDNDLFIAEEHFKNLVSKHGGPVAGDLVVSAVGTLGICYEVKPADRFYYKDASVLCFHPKTPINSRFVEYAFQSQEILDQVTAGKGATVGTFTIGRAKTTTINLPPLEEQKRIVAVLDAAFEGLTRAKENAETNLQNARELFDADMGAIFEYCFRNYDLMELDQVCDVRDGTHDSPTYVEKGIPFVTQKNVREHGLTLANTKRVSDEDHVNISKRSAVGKGDILISMIGVNRGMACLVDTDEVFSIKNVGLIKETDVIDMQFLLFYLKSPQATKYVEAATNGGAQPFIGLKKLRAFPFPNVPKNKQVQMQKKLFRGLEQSRELVDSYQTKLTNIADLRQSFLQKAFAGELT